MTRVLAAFAGLLVAGFASAALAQSTAPAPAPQAVAMSEDHAAKVMKLVDSACGPVPAATAPAGDKTIYAQCRSVATPRAEAMVH